MRQEVQEAGVAFGGGGSLQHRHPCGGFSLGLTVTGGDAGGTTLGACPDTPITRQNSNKKWHLTNKFSSP